MVSSTISINSGHYRRLDYQKQRANQMTKRNNAKVKVTDITPNGCWVRVRAKDYYLSFVSNYPHFLGASIEEIKCVSLIGDYLRWELLDIDLEIDNFEHPKRYPCLMLSKKQLEQIQNVLNYPDRYPGVTFTKVQRKKLQNKIEKIAEHWKRCGRID